MLLRVNRTWSEEVKRTGKNAMRASRSQVGRSAPPGTLLRLALGVRDDPDGHAGLPVRATLMIIIMIRTTTITIHIYIMICIYIYIYMIYVYVCVYIYIYIYV